MSVQGKSLVVRFDYWKCCKCKVMISRLLAEPKCNCKSPWNYKNDNWLDVIDVVEEVSNGNTNSKG